MPTDKRARQKAARRQKRAVAARRAKHRKQLRNSAIVVVLGGLVIGLVVLTTGGSSPSKKTSSTTTTTTALSTSGAKSAQATANKVAVAAGCPASTSTRVNTLSYPSAPALTIDTTKSYSASVKTTAGTFVIGLDAKTAPNTVNNFVFLAQHGFYHCVIFQRVIPGFMDQTGDPSGTGTGGPGYQFANENVPKSYATGDVAMANGGANTNGSQFFVVAPGGATKLSATYSLFGKVTSGMSVVDKINAEGNAGTSSNGVPPKVTQRILTVTIHES